MKEHDILELQERMLSGSLSAQRITAYYINRIALIDRSGPLLNAVIELNPDAYPMAEALDAERKAGHVRSLLHGIPVLLKDNIDTADRLTTTAGSLALEGHIAERDAFLVAQLREAGAIILGKTNLSEWANFRSTHSVSGWSSRGGQTRNPYALDRSPCGSSSGSAAAVAADLCAVAVGTETDGSIVCPAQTNGIVGIKPTLGLVSRSGIIPIAHSQDTAGPMARSVTDAAILLSWISAKDPHDPAHTSRPETMLKDYMASLDPDGLKGARIGVARNFFGVSPQTDAVMEKCLEVMKTKGALLVDPANIETANKIDESELEVLYYEFKADLNAYLGGLKPDARVHSLSELIAYNERHHDRIMPYFGQERMLKSQEKGPLEEDLYLKALEENHRLARTEGIDATLNEHNLDAIVAPTGAPAWLVDFVNGDCASEGCSTPAAVAGYPHITVPAGFVHGLPVGLSFIGTAFSEPTLLRLAFAFEQATKARRKPQFLSNVNSFDTI